MAFVKNAFDFSDPDTVKFGTEDQAAFKNNNLWNDTTNIANAQYGLNNQHVTNAQAQALPGTNVNLSAADQDRAAQNAYIQNLQAQASGAAPSVAQAQIGQAQNNNIAAILAANASQRGPVNAGLQAKSLANNMAGSNQNFIQQAGILRLQEQQGAQNNLGNALTGIRGQDTGQALDVARIGQSDRQLGVQLGTQVSLANAAQANALQQQHNSLVQQYVGMGLNLSQATLQAQIDMERTKLGVETGNAAAWNGERAAATGAVGSIIGAGASALAKT